MGWLEDYIAGIKRNGMPKADEKKQPEQNKLPEEEQQEYVDRGGVMPIAGTNDSYARQRRNGNREPVKRNADDAQPSVEPAADAAGTVAESPTANSAGTSAGSVANANGNAGDGTVLAPKDEAFKSPYEGATQNAQKNGATADGEEKGAEAGDAESKAGADRYQAILDAAKRYNEMADDEEKKLSEDDRRKVAKAAKHRMLLAGIADAANSFHQAYSYARGIKPMNEGKNYTKEAKKELREDEDWYTKNKDRILNYRAKAAELQKTAAGLKNQEDMMNWRNAEQARKEKKQLWDMQREQGKLDIEKEKLKIQRDLADGRISKMQHDMLMDELELQDKLQRTAIAQQNANRLAQGSTTVRTEDDGTGLPKTIMEEKRVGTGGANSGSNGGKGNKNGGLGWGKDDNKTDW